MSTNKKIVIGAAVILLILGGIGAYVVMKMIYLPNLEVKEEANYTYIYIPTGSNFDDVKDTLYSKGLVQHPQMFEWLAEIKDYSNNVRPGRYRIRDQMSNNELINLLRAGLQEPMTFTFNNIRTQEQIASKAGRVLEVDSAKILEHLYDQEFLSTLGFDTSTVLAMFIPNTYEMYWNINSKEFLQRMAKEYDKFWTEERRTKAEAIDLDPKEVSILASIVEHETYKNEDKPKIAGVYLNRMKINMPLQADPTLIWAKRKLDTRRVYNKDKEIDSPYNTYKNRGLPPGPIGIPSISSIEAVLNADDHSYLYFVAKDDFSGYSAFSENYKEHQIKARKYQRALNERNIR